MLRLSRHRKKVLFYCHFPDQLLTQRKSALKKLYRAPIDWLEERTTGMADMVIKIKKKLLYSIGLRFKPLTNVRIHSWLKTHIVVLI